MSKSGKGRLAAALALLLLVAAVAPPVRAAAPEPAPPATAPGLLIRVGVGRQLASAVISGEASFSVLDPGGRALLTWPAGQALTFSPSPLPAPGATLLRQVQAGPAGGPALVMHPGPLTLRPAGGPGPYLLFKGNRYAGDLEVRAAPGERLTVVNVLPLEEYLRGVVPLELGPGHPPEALKAQAVAARTYALYQRGQSRAWAAEGFDLTDDTSSQVYGGAGVSDPRTDAAIAATRGLVVTYGGKVIPAFFFSSSGGHTEDNEVVFASGQPIPYLRGVPDFDQGRPWYAWTVRKTVAELAAALGKLDGFPDLGAITAVEPAGRRGSGGRWSHWRIRGERGEYTITGTQMRLQLGLRSNPRSVAVELAAPAAAAAGAAVALAGAAVPAAAVPVAGAWHLGAGAPPGAPAAFLIQGGGWGHGVGLSQYGAVALASQGKTFTEILTYYYSGTQVRPYSGS